MFVAIKMRILGWIKFKLISELVDFMMMSMHVQLNGQNIWTCGVGSNWYIVL